MFERAMSRVPAAVPLSIVCLFMLLSTQGLADGIALMTRPKMMEASGMVRSVAVGAGINTGGRGQPVFPLVGTFTFTVGGKDYSGSTFGRLPRTSHWSHGEAERIVRGLRKTGTVPVQYDPADPSSCYADVADQSNAVAFALGFTAFTGILIVVSTVAWVMFIVRCVSRGGTSSGG